MSADSPADGANLVWRVAAESLFGGELPSTVQIVDGSSARAALESAGCAGPLLLQRAAHSRAAGQPWPPAVGLSDGLSAAQVLAAQRWLLAAFGAQGVPAGVRRPGALNADDRRLMEQRPPHHGSVG